jgi:putative ABC transport system permease protein
MGMKLVAGTNFTTTNAPIDRKRHDVLVNEMVAREFGLDDPVGQDIRAADSSGRYLKIIGVIRDFHVTSLHHKIEPLVLLNFGSSNYLACVKISSSNIGRTIEAIQQEYKNVWGDHRFEYTFLDDRFDQQYKSDEQLAEVIGYFTGIAIIIACLGLFALSSFMVSRRVKEIGVRKVLGASVSTIYSMLSWDFLKWILVAIVIATPVAWYLMKMWLSTFAYHIELGIDVFVMAALIAISIALLTVTGQSLKVARANPVDSLRYE